MIDYYRAKCITYVNGKEKSIHSSYGLFTEEQAQNKEIKITWENLDKVYYKWGLFYRLIIFNLKKVDAYHFLMALFLIETIGI